MSMTHPPLSNAEVRERGHQVLLRELGIVNYVRFIQQLETGRGDYTAERDQWLGSTTLTDIRRSVEQRRAAP